MEYKLANGQTAKQTYKDLEKTRRAALDTARELAEISVPYAFRPEGYSPGDPLGTNNQSINSDMVRTLATKLCYGAFPPGLPFVKHGITAVALSKSKAFGDDPQLISKIKLALMKRANAHRERLEGVPMRNAYMTFLTELLVGGNSCFDYVDIEHPVVRNLANYVVKRDDRGRQLIVIVEKEVLRSEIDGETLAQIERQMAQQDGSGPTKKAWYEDTLTVQRVCERDPQDEKTFRLWEECEGVYLPDSGEARTDGLPQLYAAWLIPMYGEDYGRAYCDHYRGDLYAAENANAAIQDLGAAIGRHITLVRTGGNTKLNDVKKARNNDTIPGSTEDVSSYQAQKAQDLNALTAYAQAVERRLGRAFGSTFAVQRDAERVTREEWVQLTKALDEAMGGLHSQFSQTGQRAVTEMFIRLHEEEPNSGLSKLPKEDITTSVITGIDAYGQDGEASALVEWRSTANELLTPQRVSQLTSDEEWLARFTAAKNVTPDGLLKDAEAVTQESQTAAMQGAAMQAAPGVLQEGAKALFANMAQGGQAPPQDPSQPMPPA